MEFLNSFWQFVIISAPFLLFGCGVAGLIHIFISMEKIERWLGNQSFFDSIKAAIIGIPLPLCSCSVIPTAATLRKSGASNSATSSFLIATPESGIDSIAMTYGMMDLPMTIIRVIAAFLSAIFAGFANLFFNDFYYSNKYNSDGKANSEDQKSGVEKSCCPNAKKEKSSKKFSKKLWQGIKYGYGDTIQDISVWLLIGLVAGSLINFLVPENFFLDMGPTMGKLLILIIGVPLYICASATTPIAAGLVLKGMSPGTALILLLVGPATNISNIAVMQKYIGKRGVLINIICIVLVALICGSLTDYLYDEFSWSVNFKVASHQHESSNFLLDQFFAIILSVLVLRGVFFEKIKPLIKKDKKHCH